MAKRGKNQPTLQEHTETLRIACENLPWLITVSGECEFLRAEAVAAIRQAWQDRFPDGDMAILRGVGEGRPATVNDISQELSGGSLFAKDKLVVVRQAEKPLFPQSGKSEQPGPAAAEREKAFMAVLELED